VLVITPPANSRCSGRRGALRRLKAGGYWATLCLRKTSCHAALRERSCVAGCRARLYPGGAGHRLRVSHVPRRNPVTT
jgi:hypothetical protein